MTGVPVRFTRPERIFEGYVFDLDGTLYLGDDLLPGSRRLLTALRACGARVLFLSNNPTRTPEEYVAKLARLGIEAHIDEVLSTVITTVAWITAECPEARVFAVAEEPLIAALRRAGVTLSDDPAEIDVVIASFDRTLDYRKLQIAFDALWRRDATRFVATNPDPYCPMPDGGQPDAGSVIAALEAATGRRCERHFGKPGPAMMDAALDRLGVAPADCIVVGDRLSTDIAAARCAGTAAALVLTGETDATMLARATGDQVPDYVLGAIDELLPASAWEGLDP